MTKAEAVKALMDAGERTAAKQLDSWRDRNGQNWGWDGWLRGAWPDFVDIVWPQQGKRPKK